MCGRYGRWSRRQRIEELLGIERSGLDDFTRRSANDRGDDGACGNTCRPGKERAAVAVSPDVAKNLRELAAPVDARSW